MLLTKIPGVRKKYYANLKTFPSEMGLKKLVERAD